MKGRGESMTISLIHRCRNQEARGARAPPHFSYIFVQSAPLQLKKLPVFVYEGAPEYKYPPLFECFLRFWLD